MKIIKDRQLVEVTDDMVNQVFSIPVPEFADAKIGQFPLFGSQCPGYGRGGYVPATSTEPEILQLGSGTDSVLGHMKFLKENGVSHIICVDNSDNRQEELKFIWEHYFEGEEYLLSRNGVYLTVPDYTPLSTEQLREICERVYELQQQGKRVLIHCGHGSGRTGICLAAAKMYIDGYNYSQAIHHVRQYYHQHAIDNVSCLKAFQKTLDNYSTECLGNIKHESERSYILSGFQIHEAKHRQDKESQRYDMFHAGTSVIACGLKNAQHLNGEQGIVVKQGDERHIVRFDESIGDKSIKPQNLRLK